MTNISKQVPVQPDMEDFYGDHINANLAFASANDCEISIAFGQSPPFKEMADEDIVAEEGGQEVLYVKPAVIVTMPAARIPGVIRMLKEIYSTHLQVKAEKEAADASQQAPRTEGAPAAAPEQPDGADAPRAG
jgi:hypothetical protein